VEMVKMPGQSIVCRVLSSRDSCAANRVTATAPTATGRFRKKIARQLTCSVRKPPTTGPTASASADTPAHVPIARPGEASGYPGAVASAVDLLKRNGLEGPYGLALSREEWTRVVETGELGGYPLFDHLKSILDGPIVWTPGLQGAVVLTLRGGDFLFHCGQDVSVGYTSHDGDAVALYLEASFTFRNVTPEAAVAIT